MRDVMLHGVLAAPLGHNGEFRRGVLNSAAARSGRNLAPGGWALRAISAERTVLLSFPDVHQDEQSRNVLFGHSYSAPIRLR